LFTSIDKLYVWALFLPVFFWANAPCTQPFLTCTQHIFLISKNALNSGNKNLELKIIYSGKINPEVIIEFRK